MGCMYFTPVHEQDAIAHDGVRRQRISRRDQV
jgi:hypothetical protein